MGAAFRLFACLSTGSRLLCPCGHGALPRPGRAKAISSSVLVWARGSRLLCLCGHGALPRAGRARRSRLLCLCGHGALPRAGRAKALSSSVPVWARGSAPCRAGPARLSLILENLIRARPNFSALSAVQTRRETTPALPALPFVPCGTPLQMPPPPADRNRCPRPS